MFRTNLFGLNKAGTQRFGGSWTHFARESGLDRVPGREIELTYGPTWHQIDWRKLGSSSLRAAQFLSHRMPDRFPSPKTHSEHDMPVRPPWMTGEQVYLGHNPSAAFPSARNESANRAAGVVRLKQALAPTEETIERISAATVTPPAGKPLSLLNLFAAAALTALYDEDADVTLSMLADVVLGGWDEAFDTGEKIKPEEQAFSLEYRHALRWDPTARRKAAVELLTRADWSGDAGLSTRRDAHFLAELFGYPYDFMEFEENYRVALDHQLSFSDGELPLFADFYIAQILSLLLPSRFLHLIKEWRAGRIDIESVRLQANRLPLSLFRWEGMKDASDAEWR